MKEEVEEEVEEEQEKARKLSCLLLYKGIWNFFCVIVLAVSNQASKSFH